MAYTYINTLQYLPEAVTGIKINNLDINHDSKQPYKDYKLVNMPQQISWRLIITTTALLEQVYFNLIKI